MNHTLFSEIQRLFERTYASIGVNLEECLIDDPHCRQLSAMAGAQAAELSMIARTFLRTADGRLKIGIYYSKWLIEQLEKHDPRAGLSELNIRALIAFVEEINHALHASLQFLNGRLPARSEEYARNLELQGQVDTYLVLMLFTAFFRKPGKMTARDRRWLRFHMFNADNPRRYRDPQIACRYRETTSLASKYTRYLDQLNNLGRIEEIRAFHLLDYDAKKTRILALTNGSRT